MSMLRYLAGTADLLGVKVDDDEARANHCFRNATIARDPELRRKWYGDQKQLLDLGYLDIGGEA